MSSLQFLIFLCSRHSSETKVRRMREDEGHQYRYCLSTPASSPQQIPLAPRNISWLPPLHCDHFLLHLLLLICFLSSECLSLSVHTPNPFSIQGLTHRGLVTPLSTAFLWQLCRPISDWCLSVHGFDHALFCRASLLSSLPHLKVPFLRSGTLSFLSSIPPKST